MPASQSRSRASYGAMPASHALVTNAAPATTALVVTSAAAGPTSVAAKIASFAMKPISGGTPAMLAAPRAAVIAVIGMSRWSSGANGSRELVLFAAKYSQAKEALGTLVESLAQLPNVHLAIKAHPAETPDVYLPLIRGAGSVHPGRIKVLPPDVPLGPLLRASRVIVTVNSTVALDAGVLGIPALVIGLPNNLSPFVAAGIMAGAATRADIEPALRRILYDEEFRVQIERSRVEYFKRFAIGSDGRAAARSADAVLRLAGAVV